MNSSVACWAVSMKHGTLTVSALTYSTCLQTLKSACTHTHTHTHTHTYTSECPHTNEGISHGEAFQRNHLVARQQHSSAPMAWLILIAIFVCECWHVCLSSCPVAFPMQHGFCPIFAYLCIIYTYSVCLFVSMCVCVCVTVSDLQGK